ncbi:IS110 family transposase [Parasediminibacterium paludis]|uniref:IS110 family transposase n=1 Tax=Parasediminibacterium paludis TaxID=908966 RepID=A0ABV8PTZ5_9BACT
MKKQELSLQVVNEHAAGIDIGSRFYMVAIDQVKEHVRQFGVYTKDHEQLIDYLRNAGITSIAMESTGNYWQTLFSTLQQAGFEVMLVGGNQTKNVKGRKTDVIDCMWIQKLHSLGLLSGSFLLSDAIQELRTYYHHRLHLIEQASMYVHKMQKALRLMNIRLDIVIRDVVGKSGLNIVEAILAGNRNPEHLSSLVDVRVKKSQQEIADALQGEWQEELLFELKASLNFYKIYDQALLECDKQIEDKLIRYIPQSVLDPQEEKMLKENSKKSRKHAPALNVSRLAYQYFRTYLFAISGISHTTALCLLTNMGHDLHKFPSAKSFSSWLRLVPNNKISGGHIISNKTPRGKNLIATALRQAANSIGNQKDHELTPFFKRIAFKKGRIAAITATARKLAVIIWNMVTKVEPYKKTLTANSDKNKANQLKHIEKRIGLMQQTQDELKRLFLRTSLLVE